MRRSFRKEVSQRKIDQASKDFLTPLGRVQDVQKRFRIGYPAARQALDEADRIARERGASERLRRERKIDRLVKIVRKAESRYPRILSFVMRSKDFAEIARKYPSRVRKSQKLTRPRVYQIHTNLRTLCKMTGRPIASIVRDAERGNLRTRLEMERAANRLR